MTVTGIKIKEFEIESTNDRFTLDVPPGSYVMKVLANEFIYFGHLMVK
jgi:hypothetical protein